LAHPFFDHDEPVGVLTLARLHRAEPLRAGEVNVIRTLSEFFMQRVMSFRVQESLIETQLNRRELELAAGIQKSLLPMSMPSVPGFSAVGHCESALAVGGDFYDAFPGENGGVIFAIADVMGKGVGASMVAAITRAAIRSAVAHFKTPAGMLKHAGGLLFDDLDRLEMFVTVVIGLVDPERGMVEIANAGHCPVLLAGPDGVIHSAEPHGVPIGLEPDPEIKQSSFPMAEGSCLLAFTDGLIDPRASRNFDSPEAVAEWLKANTVNGPTAKEVKEALLDRLRDDADEALLSDDQTFLVIARDPSPLESK
jgi:sigma-B regulation protein RsbU (phosphoserine phosphatase)